MPDVDGFFTGELATGFSDEEADRFVPGFALCLCDGPAASPPEPPVVVNTLPQVLEVNVWATDLVEIKFNQLMENRLAILQVTTYRIVPADPGAAVTIREVRTGRDLATDRVFLVISPPTIGACYDISVVGDVRSLLNESMAGVIGKRTLMRETKIDRLVRTRPKHQDVSPGSTLRNLLNAFGRADDLLGGEVFDCENGRDITQ